MTTETHVIGDGCSAMMLASRADELEGHNLTIIRPEGAPETKDHMLGFWNTPGLKFAEEVSRASWSNWSIITDSGEFKMSSEKYAYHAMHKVAYLESCRIKSELNLVKFTEENNLNGKNPDYLFDSRPPKASKNAMLQHFLGQEVEVDRPVFDTSTAILMDFRVDQSHGMHFIYLLPFSPTRALVESTLFSTKVLEDEFYMDSISQYLSSHFGVNAKEIIHQEKGVIPMGNLSPHDPSIPGLGANAGAIRPASGYTFVFIHQQIQRAIVQAQKGKRLKFKRPHKAVDVWMDGVLLTVLRHWPSQGPKLFARMAQRLTGDEFIQFMSGNASLRIRLKVIMAMPKLPFIRGASRFIFSRPQKVVS